MIFYRALERNLFYWRLADIKWLETNQNIKISKNEVSKAIERNKLLLLLLYKIRNGT